MHVRIDHATLAEALSAATRIAPKQHAKSPVLTHVRLSAKDDGLHITATDLDRTLKMRVDVEEMIRPGVILVPAAPLCDIAKLAASEFMSLEQDGPNVRIRSGRAKHDLVLCAVENYPDIQAPLPGGISVSAETLKDVIDKTLPAVSSDETRHVLNGVCLERDGSMLHATSTDGHRLALLSRNAEVLGDVQRVVVPGRALEAVGNLLLADYFDGVVVAMAGGHVQFTAGDRSLMCRLIDGKFPDWRQIVPERRSAVVVDRAEFLDALKRTTVLPRSAERECITRIHVEPNGPTTPGRMVLTTRGADGSECVQDIDADYEGEERRAGFNARYLMDDVQKRTSDKVVIDFGDELQPALIISPNDEGHVGLVMPMRW